MRTANALITGAAALGVPLSGGMGEKFENYMDMLLEWSERMNLTAITEPIDVVQKHFLDSLSVLSVPGLVKAGASVIDVGTGAGFPGLPLKIARPDIRLTLMDSLRKRVDFLEAVVETLKLSDVSCVHMRAEDGGRNTAYRDKFDVAVSRAVADLSVLAEYCLPFVAVGGKLVSMKGPRPEAEIFAAKEAIHTLGGETADVVTVSIPQTDIVHSLIIIRKLRETPTRYPRRPGKIPKSPTL